MVCKRNLEYRYKYMPVYHLIKLGQKAVITFQPSFRLIQHVRLCITSGYSYLYNLNNRMMNDYVYMMVLLVSAPKAVLFF